ncbi:MAG: hypothetical protein ACOC78_02495 [Actinomycetota bacterium]
MKTCPWCGRSNLDSDEYCFNCERLLSGIPSEEDFRELEREKRRVQVSKLPSFWRLIVNSIIKKTAFLLLALGLFCIFALVAIWVSYDNTTLALAVLAVMGAAVIFACYYPDYALSRRIGTRGVLISVLSNAVLLAIVIPLALWFLSRRDYISGPWHLLSRIWWGLLIFIALGGIISWVAGYRSAAEIAKP